MTHQKPVKPQLQDSVQLSVAIAAMRKHGLLAGAVGVLLAGSAIVVTLWVWEPVYQAKHFVRVKQDKEYFQIVPDRLRTEVNPKSVLAPLTSDLILRRVLLEPEVHRVPRIASARDAVNELRKMTGNSPNGGDLFAITAQDPNPKHAAIVSHTLRDKLLEYRKDYREESLREMEASLDAKIKDTQELIDQKTKELIKMGEEFLVVPMKDFQQPDIKGGQLIAARNGWNQANARLEDLQQERMLVDLLAKEGPEFSDEELLAVINESSRVYSIRQNIRRLEEENLEDEGLGRRNPKIESRQRVIEARQAELEETISVLLELEKSRLEKQKQREIKNRYEAIRREELLVQSRLQRFESQITDLIAEVHENSVRQFEYAEETANRNRLYTELNKWNDARSRITSQHISPLMVEAVSLDNAKPDTLQIPAIPMETYPFKLLGMVGAVAFALPFGLALAWEFRVRRISFPAQVDRSGGVGLIAEIAHLPLGGGNGSKRVSQQLKLYEESVDNLCTVIATSGDAMPQVIAITSAASNEGKTTLASQLAISVARSSFQRTLIIDADLRSPSLHRLFDVSCETGLVDALSGMSSLEDVVLTTEIENLDVLPAGRLTANPRRYFANGEWTAFLRRAKEHYAHIIVDTPPVLAASESLAVSKACDSTLLCVLRDISRVDSVQRAQERLTNAHVTLGGCVFGGVPQNAYAYKYGSYGYNIS